MSRAPWSLVRVGAAAAADINARVLVAIVVAAAALASASLVAQVVPFRPLFDGKNLDGWDVPSGRASHFVITESVLRVTGDSGLLLTASPYGGDDVFSLRFEARQIEPGTVAGILLQVAPAERESPLAHELLLADEHGVTGRWVRHEGGGLSPLAFEGTPAKADEVWHSYLIEYADGVLRATRDGVALTRIGVPEAQGSPCYRVGIEVLEGTMEFRNIEVASPGSDLCLDYVNSEAMPRIQSQWESSRPATGGQVTAARFKIQPTGTITDIEISESSGSEELDSAVVRSLTSTQLPPVPRRCGCGPLNVTMRFRVSSEK
jgi:TonB family protein